MASTAHDQLVPILRWLFGTALTSREDVGAKARMLLLDTVGCVLAGLDAGVPQALARELAQTRPGTIALPKLAPIDPQAATELFAMCATWDEACEGLARAHGRPGVPVIAACLPLALQSAASLGALLDAIVAGYEVGGRMGEWLRIRPGMHVDAGWPAIGVAAAVARLSGRSPDEALTALELVGCQVPFGLYASARAGANGRNTYLSHAAGLGLMAARAAAAGCDAPADGLSSYAALALGRDEAAALLPAGVHVLLEGYLKPFAAVRHVHYGAAAALQLRDRLYARLGEVEDIELTVYDEAITYCANSNPRTPLAAQFSLTFGVAAALRFGELTPAVYRDDRFFEAGVRRLESMVRVVADPAHAVNNTRGATLAVRIDGKPLRASVLHVKGDPSEPMSADECRAKFLDYASPRVTRDAAQRFASALLDGPLDQPFQSLWGRLQ